MKNLIPPFVLLLLLLVKTSDVSCQQLSPQELLAKSIEYHGPSQFWNSYNGILYFEEQQPDKEVRKTQVHIDNTTGYFKINRGNELISGMLLDSCFVEKGDISCERTNILRDYYLYLWGLPMKLLDHKTVLSKEVSYDTLNGTPYFTLQVNYPSDNWTFYFSRENYSLCAYKFIKPDQTGEFILLRDVVLVAGMKIPKNRSWYTLQDEYLGTDILNSTEKTKFH